MSRDHRADAAMFRSEAALLRELAGELDRRAAAHEHLAEPELIEDTAFGREAARAALLSATAQDLTATFV